MPSLCSDKMKSSALRVSLLDEIMPVTSQLGKRFHDTEEAIGKIGNYIGVISHK